jgi:predicted Zn-dependent peptidase
VRADVTGAALKEIFVELDGLAAGGKSPLSEVDMQLAREALIQNFPEGFATPGSVLSSLQELAEYGLDRVEWTNYIPRVAKLTDEQIRQVMAGLVSANQRLVVIAGDRKLVEPQLKKAGFEKIVLIPLEELTDAKKASDSEPAQKAARQSQPNGVAQ